MMKRAILFLAVLAMESPVWAETVCFEVNPLVADCVRVKSDVPPMSDIVKALELAVRHTEMENTDTSILTTGTAGYFLPSQETKANRKRREAKEALERAEAEAKRLEQHDKDVQFIRDILKRVKGEK